MRVLLSGASGFIGRAILPALHAAGHEVRIAGRTRVGDNAFMPVDFAALDHIMADRLLNGIDAVIHAAGYAHAESPDAALHDSINRVAVVRLAEAAARRGALLVQLSSIKALGSPLDGHLPEQAVAPPIDAYGRAKYEAEVALRRVLPDRHVILRPALVVGEGARGNLARLLALARLPLPLPFATAMAPRAMISRADVVALVIRALVDPALLGRSVTLADPDHLGLADILSEIRAGFGRKPGLFAVSPALLARGLNLIGKSAEAERLFSPLIASPRVLSASGWQPVQPVRAALRAMAAALSAHNPAPPTG